MEQVESPGSRTYQSLDDAFAAQQIPLENRPLIRRVCGAIGIASFEERAGYIKAARSDEGPALHIAYGYTNGFSSKDEVLAAAGAHADCWPSKRSHGLWGLSHPINQISERSAGLVGSTVDYGTCQRCFLALPATGECDCA